MTLAQKGVTYTTKIQGNLSAELQDICEKTSILKRLESRPPLTLFALEQRATKDIKEIIEELHAYGYFDAKVSFKMEEKAEKYKIFISVEPGPVYTLSALNVLYLDHAPGMTLDLLTIHPSIFLGAPVNLKKAEETAKKIAKYFRTHGYAFAKAKDLRGEIDKAKKTVSLSFVLKLGPPCTFGETSVEGLENLSEAYIRNRFDYTKNQAFDESLLDSTRKALIESGLFNDVRIHAVKISSLKEESVSEFNESAQVFPQKANIAVSVKEGPPRSFGFGGKYSTSDGVSGRTFWRHDNSFGGGESFEASLLLGKRKNEGRLALSTPDFLTPKQTLLTAATATDEKTRAYRSKGGKLSGILSRDLSATISFSYGLEAEMAKLKKNKAITHSRLLSIPLMLDIDTTNDLLNPREGTKLRLKSTPYTGRYNKRNGFWSNETFGAFYLHPAYNGVSNPDNISMVAGWAKGGHISSENVEFVPPNKRFYSGGGNSIRGYGYQLLGPIDANRTPIGGLSVIEFGIEPRLKLTEQLGCVAFLEAGTVGLKHSPKFDTQNLLWGTGVGLRYYTGIGPIRFDLGFPLKRRRTQGVRKKLDAPFQFYLSIGQAF